MATAVKRLLVGRALRTEQAAHERLTKKTALAVFSSDALSSTAYATEEILLVLAVAAAATSGASFTYVVPVSIGIAVLLGIVATSYRQTIHAYPSGGGAYIVAKENLGTTPGLTAAASLLVDYVLTVSVSVAAGVAAARVPPGRAGGPGRARAARGWSERAKRAQGDRRRRRQNVGRGNTSG